MVLVAMRNQYYVGIRENRVVGGLWENMPSIEIGWAAEPRIEQNPVVARLAI